MKALVVFVALCLATFGTANLPVPLVKVEVKKPQAPKPKKLAPKPRERHAKLSYSEAACLASVIYYEARGEPLHGQRAVYDVVMHRAKVLRKSLCAVVTAPKQFSWYGEPDKPIRPLTKPMQDFLNRVKDHPKVLDSVSFRWFFSGERFPYWAKKMDCHKLGGHRFCREREKQEDGSTREVRYQGESSATFTE